ncbi:hypothetical protein [Cohnella sp. GCM10012308]|uniref:hypothetical protein n=1 Tax=Cohnella sp. GCM10012308 TaxID=3317329 RepID=UPI003613C4B8
MATLAASMSLYDRFTSKLRSVNDAMQRTINLATQLQGAMRSEFTVRIDAGGAVGEMERLRSRINALGSGVLHVLIDSSQVTRELARIQTQVRSGAAGAALRLNIDTAHLRAQVSSALGGLHSTALRINALVRLDTAAALRQASLLRQQIIGRIGTIVAHVQLIVNAQLSGVMGNLESTFDRLIDAIDRLITKIDSGGGGPGGSGGFGGIRGIVGVVSSVLAALGVGSAYKSAVGGAMQQQQTLDTFSARAGSEAAGGAIFDALTKQALALRQNVDQSLSGAMSFMSNTTDPKRLAELSKLSMRLQKLNPFENLEGAAFSMKELLSGDYTSIVERFNIGRAQIKNSDALKAGKAGDIDGFIKGMDKLLNQQNMSEKAFMKMLDSPAAKWNGVLETFKFKFKQTGADALSALEPLFDYLLKAFDSGKFDPFFKIISAGFWLISNAINGAVHAAVWFGDVFVDYWPIISSLLIAVAGIIIYQVTPALWAMLVPIYRQVVAWLAAYWPVLLVAAAVGVLIYVLLQMGVTVEQIVGAVMGFFFVLAAFIYNKVVYLWNIFASFAEFLINLFIDPVYSVKKLFYDLAMTFLGHMYNMLMGAEGFAQGFMKVVLDGINGVLKGVRWLTDALNKLPGFDISKPDLFDTDNVHAMSDAVQDLMNNLEAPTTDKDVVNIPRLDEWSYTDAAKQGYDLGSGFVGKIKDSLDGFNLPKGDGKGNIGNIGKVGEVGKIGDTVDISSEDLKVMRDLAEIKAIQNFVTLTPTVQVTTGPINKGMDVDEIIVRINRSMEEEIASSAQSVFE